MTYSSLPAVVGGEPIASSWGNLVDSNLDDHEARLGKQATAVAKGTATVTYTALNTAASAAVTFPAGRFVGTPAVNVTILSNAPLQFSPATVLSKTPTGFTVYLAKTAGTTSGTINVDWIAVE